MNKNHARMEMLYGELESRYGKDDEIVREVWASIPSHHPARKILFTPRGDHADRFFRLGINKKLTGFVVEPNVR